MAYIDPNSIHNPSTGTSPPAAWGDQLRDNDEWLARSRPHCRAYSLSNRSIPHATVTPIILNAERQDVGGMHTTSGNNTRITVPTGGDGFYLLTASASFAPNVTGERILDFRVNGSTFIARERISANAVAGLDTSMTLSTMYQLVAGDYVELCAYQSSGGALNITSSAEYTPEFAALWLCI